MKVLRSNGTLKAMLVKAVSIDVARTFLARRSTGLATVFLLHRAAGVYDGINGYDPGPLEQLLIEFKRRRFNLVTAQQVVDAACGLGSLPSGAIAFTIDDGYRDQLEVLAPIFVKHQVPVTVFLTTGLVNSELWPWDAKINWLIRHTRKSSIELKLGHHRLKWPTRTPREHLYTRRELQAIGATVPGDELADYLQLLAASAELEIPETPPPEFTGASWEQVRQLEDAGVRFAPHTHTHRILSRLSEEEVRFELGHSLKAVMAQTHHGLPILAYPVGREQHFGLREMRLAETVGYRGAFAVCEDNSRWGEARDDSELRYRLGRFGLPCSLPEALWLATGLEVMREPHVKFVTGQFGVEMNNNRSMAQRLRPLKMKHKVLARRFVDKLNLYIGRYDKLKHIQAERIKRLVFVCRGNVCRSPYAEAAAKSLGLSATSCGIDVVRSAPAEANAVRAAFLRGKDISRHMSQSIFDVSLDSSDCLVVMDPSHLRTARNVAGYVGCQVTLIGLWGIFVVPRIDDPYGKPLHAFSRCFDKIDDALEGLSLWIEQVPE